MGINVIFASSEAVPFAKTGGLADVAGALPPALERFGLSPIIIMPLYRDVRTSGIEIKPTGIKVNVQVGWNTIESELHISRSGELTVYFLECDEYFDREQLYGGGDGDYIDNLERFTFFSRGVLEAARALDFRPDIIHCNDWQTGLLPAYLKDTFLGDPFFARTATVFTIHNLAYQGLFDAAGFQVTNLARALFGLSGLEFWGKVSLLKSALVYSDIITTVSPTYAKEIRTKRLGAGFDGLLKYREDSLYGILNGADYSVWNPETDPHITHYSYKDLKGKKASKKALMNEFSLKPNSETALVGIISRLVDQKGFDIIKKAMGDIIKMKLSLVLLGTGEKRYEDFFRGLSERYPGRVGVRIGYDEAMAHRIEAGSDIFLMPSRYEPCGLNQIYSLKYGTVPVVRATGGA